MLKVTVLLFCTVLLDAQLTNPEDDDDTMSHAERHFYNWAAYTLITVYYIYFLLHSNLLNVSITEKSNQRNYLTS